MTQATPRTDPAPTANPTALDPIEKSVEVPLDPEAAFDLFTRRMETWWPVDSHSLSAADGGLPKQITVEPQEGGQILETKPDGSNAPWGRITRWEPGRAFGVAWHVGRPEDEATDLLVVFSATSIGTRVDLTHGGFERLGSAATAMAGNYRTGWDLVLAGRFGAACRRASGATMPVA